MHGHGYPWSPQPPPNRDRSTLIIVLVVVGAVFVLGAGACVVLGGLMFLSADASGPVSAEPPVASATPAVASATAARPEDTSGLSPMPDDTGDEPSDPSNGEAANAGDDPSGDPTGDPLAGPSPTSTAKSPTGTWFCNATGWVRVCGFANVCSNQMVSGIGSGTDRFVAQMMAKNACEGMARAKGGSTVCSVTCTVR